MAQLNGAAQLPTAEGARVTAIHTGIGTDPDGTAVPGRYISWEAEPGERGQVFVPDSALTEDVVRERVGNALWIMRWLRENHPPAASS